MSHMTDATTHTARRKEHRCEWCWGWIRIGETYCRYRFYSEGEVHTVVMHPECFDAMQEAASEEGGFIEWLPGEFERGAKESQC